MKYGFLTLAFSFSFFFVAQAQRVVGTRTICVGDTLVVKPSDFSCSSPTAVVYLYNSLIPSTALLRKINPLERSWTFQANQIGQFSPGIFCDNDLLILNINVVSCDSGACIGPNLVPNPSFETIANCLTAPRTNLTGIVADWQDYPIASTAGSSDYYNTLLCPYPSNGFFARNIELQNRPRTGNAMVGFYLNSQRLINNVPINQPEFTGVRLRSPLQVGKRYNVKFYTKATTSFQNNVVDKVEIVFLTDDPANAFRRIQTPIGNNSFEITFNYEGDPPRFSVPSRAITDTIFWTEIQGSFIADKPYSYLMLGNFGNIRLTLNPFLQAYYLFDDVSVREVGVDFSLQQADTLVCRNQTATFTLNTPLRRATLLNLTTGERRQFDTFRTFSVPNVNSRTCYRLTDEVCQDTYRFCTSNYRDYDTTITRLSCRLRDTGLAVVPLRTINGCDSIIRLRTIFRQIDTTQTTQFVCDSRDAGVLFQNLTNTEGCDSVVKITRIFRPSDTTRLSFVSCLPRDTGLVIEKLKNRFGCDSILLKRTNLTTPINIDLGRDTVVAEGTRFSFAPILRGDSVKSVKWDPPLNLSCTTCLSPEIIATKSISYRLTVISSGNCLSEATRLVLVRPESFVFVPTAFSPNGDGINDQLIVFANPTRVKSIRHFVVFNRWGNKVFEQRDFPPNDTAFAWDGANAMNEVFVYSVEVELFNNETRRESGDITVFR